MEVSYILVKKTISFLIKTTIIIIGAIIISAVISLLVKVNFFNAIFGLSLIFVCIWIFTFLDGTSQISSNPCGKRYEFTNDMTERNKRKMYIARAKGDMLSFVRLGKINILVSGIALFVICILFGK
jgi:hypothetical protein